VQLKIKNIISIIETYPLSASFTVMMMLLADASRHKCRTFQFDVIGAFLPAKMRIRIFIKLPSIYGELLP
jgi:hypothetical protein